MTTISPSAMATLRRQHGVITRHQLLECGSSRSSIETLRRAGALDVVIRGVYHVPVAPLDEVARSTAVCLARPDLVISGSTAGRYWDFRELPDDRRVHVIAPPMSHPTSAPWIKPYRTAAIYSDDVITLGDGRKITTRARTALDLARELESDPLLSVIEQAACDGRLSSDDLRSTAIDWMSPQRRWLRDFLLTLDRRVSGGAADSHEEAMLGDALVRAGVRGLRRQFAIDLPDYGPARFDLAVPHLRWAIEVDGFPTHRETAGRQRDCQRDDSAQLLGWSTTRLGPDVLGPRRDHTVGELVAEYRRLQSAA